MTFAFTVEGSTPTLTHSGVDTGLTTVSSAIAAILVVTRTATYALGVLLKPPAPNGFIYRCSVAGTTAAASPAYGTTAGGATVDGTAQFVAIPAPYGQTVGSKTVYRISTFRMLFNGTLTYDAKIEGFEFYDCPVSPIVALNSPCVLTINSLRNGQATYEEALVTRPVNNSVQTEFIVNGGATFNLNGAKLVVAGTGNNNYQSIFFNKGATVNINKGWIKSSTNQTRWGEQGSGNMLNMNINGMVAEKIYTTIFGVFGNIIGLAPLESVTQMVSYGAFTSLSLRDYAPLDSGSFLDNYDIPSLLVINSLGSGLDFRSGQGPGKWITLTKEFTLRALTAAGAAINGASLYIKDTNNGGRVNIPLIPGQISDNVYIQSTSVLGVTPVTSLYVMHAQAQGPYQSLPIRDYRTKTTAAGADLFDVSVWAYGYAYAALNDVPMKGNGVLALSSNLLADANVTLTETNAVAKLASSFTVVGNSLTVTQNSTLDDMYDAMKAYKTRPVQAQLEFPSIGVQPITAAGNQLTTAMTVTVGAGVTLLSGAKFKSLASTGIILTGNVSGLTIIGNVTQATPANLTNMTITGTLTYNTAIATPVIFTGVTAGNIVNSGAGAVTVKLVNSTATAGANVTTFRPTSLVFTLDGGRVRVLDNVGVEQFNQTTNGAVELPAAATGTWTYAIRKYGNQQVVAALIIDGTIKAITPAYIPDTNVVDTQANVAAYTELNSTQRIYDYLAHFGTLATGIASGVVASKGFGTLTVPAGLVTDLAAASVLSISAGVVTAKTASLLETATLISSGAIVTNATVLSDTIAVRASNLDSELAYTADNMTFYPTLLDRDNGTNAGATITGGLYRFKFGAIVSGVILSGTAFTRVSTGGVKFFADTTLVAGRNVLDLGVQSQLAAIKKDINDISPKLGTINNGVKKSSLLIPHTDNLP